MKRNIFLLIGFALSLAACSGEQKIVQKLTIRASDSAKVLSLVQATERVMNRRLAAINVKNAHASVVPTGTNTATLTLTLPTAETASRTKEILAEPFTFDLRIEEPKAKDTKNDTNASLPTEASVQAGDWTETTLTGSSIVWVQAVGNKATGVVSIELQFTEEGKKALADVFTQNVGKNLGVFVRDLLVSKMSITTEKVEDHVIISGIPSAAIAEVFADDVNVGLFVSFTNP